MSRDVLDGVVEEQVVPAHLREDERLLLAVDGVVRRDAAAAEDRAARIGPANLAARRLGVGSRRAVVAQLAVEEVVVEIGVVALDQTARRRVVLRGRERERPAVAERVDALDEPLAERRLADDEAAVVILDAARDDLARGRRAVVDEDDERGLGAMVALGGVVLIRPRDPSAGVDDELAFRDE